MEIKNESNVVKFLKAVDAGHDTISSAREHMTSFGLSARNVYGARTTSIRCGYVIMDSEFKYNLTDLGIHKLKFPNTRHGRGKANAKYGVYMGTFLHGISSFKYPISKNIIKSKYNYSNFSKIFFNAKCRGYIIEENGKYSLSEKGLQRLHILDMQLNNSAECTTSSNKCMNARVVEVKKQVTVTNETLPTITPEISMSNHAAETINLAEDIPETALTIEPVRKPQRSFLSRIVSSIFG